LQAGDIILKIGDQEVSEINLQEGVKLMRGLPGTKVSLTISRAEKNSFLVEIEREIITITSVKGYLLDEGIGYIRISNFQLPSAKLLKEVVKKITTKNKSKLNSLIIDLRNNPGGALSAAIDISDLFIDKNDTVVYTEGRSERSNISFDAKRGDIINGAPIVVLINEGSASASEIVAGALQDHKRATIMGQKSFGKGSVQSLLDLEDGYGMKLTTARFYTPLGHVIQDNGITPDIILDTDTESGETAQDLTTKEQGEDGQLRDDPTTLNATEILKRQDAITEKTNQEIIEYLMQDHDIKEAINYLLSLTQEQTI
jgi:carboxyl-terminal processing protease